MKKVLFSFVLLLVLSSYGCKNHRDNDEENTEVTEDEPTDFEDASETDKKFPDDSYCAEVEYYNPNTGTRSNYTLTVDVENNEIVSIDFPQGWLDGGDFSSEALDDNGYASIRTYEGYEYDIQITGSGGGCYENVPMAVQCQGTTEDGEQCERLTDNQSGYCWQHEN